MIDFLNRLLDRVASLVDSGVAQAKLLIARAVVLLTALNSYLIAFAVAAPVLAEKVSNVLPAPTSEKVTAILLTLAGIATSISLVIRRSTVVPKSERQILPLRPLSKEELKRRLTGGRVGSFLARR
jgi:hypothetical protein